MISIHFSSESQHFFGNLDLNFSFTFLMIFLEISKSFQWKTISNFVLNNSKIRKNHCKILQSSLEKFPRKLKSNLMKTFRLNFFQIYTLNSCSKIWISQKWTENKRLSQGASFKNQIIILTFFNQHILRWENNLFKTKFKNYK